MQIIQPLAAGAFGAGALTAVHETARHSIDNSPRVELLGIRAIEKFILSPLGITLTYNQIYGLSIASDLITNGLGYATIASVFGKNRSQLFAACALYGAAVGVATWLSPPHLGLGQQPTSDRQKTSALTVLWYVLGGVATAVAYSFLNRDDLHNDDAVGVFTETFEISLDEV